MFWFDGSWPVCVLLTSHDFFINQQNYNSLSKSWGLLKTTLWLETQPKKKKKRKKPEFPSYTTHIPFDSTSQYLSFRLSVPSSDFLLSFLRYALFFFFFSLKKKFLLGDRTINMVLELHKASSFFFFFLRRKIMFCFD